jgi:PAS domain S-box-containing protein
MATDSDTHRRETLQNLAALLQLSSEMMATVGVGGRIETLNRVWEYILGIPFEELRRALFQDLFHPDDREKIRNALQDLSFGDTVSPLEVRGRRSDGADVWISLRLAALSSYGAYLVVGQDITALKAARQERSDGQRMTELGLLAAVIAHDFNNVLSMILGCSSMLRLAPGLTPQSARELDDLDGAARHGSELVQQVFAHGRRKPPRAGDADLNKVIAQMGWMLRRLGRKNVAVDLVLARDLGRVKAEEVQLEQVVLNLAINARDAMPEGGRLLIETADIRGAKALSLIQPPIPSGDYVRLSVVDGGHGIPAELRTRIFEPFFTTKKTGTGLGLFSVKRIVDLCGGHIRLRSGPAEGTTFEIYFPRASAPRPGVPL